MSYVNTKTLEVVTGNDILRDNPNVSFPPAGWTDEDLAPFGYANLIKNNKPIPKLYERVVALPPEKIDGLWIQSYTVEEISKEEKDQLDEEKSTEVRTRRNNELVASDWTQGKDIPDSISKPWADYRQKLREITNDPGFPWNVVFPTPPIL